MIDQAGHRPGAVIASCRAGLAARRYDRCVDEAVLTGQGEPPGAAPAGTAGGPARAGARVPRWANLPYAIVLAATAGGLAWVALGGLRHVQAGMLMVASALLTAAVLRLVLPERAAGLLVSRLRVLDVLALAGLGAGIMAAVLVLPAP